jgi:LPS sulfotransferase NodH
MAYTLGMIPFWPQPKVAFVIFGQGRTGSTLLADLLNSSEDIHCDREIFNRFHFTGEIIKNPLRYIIGRSKRFYRYAYGFKVKIYQLNSDHRVASPRGLLEDLIRSGFRIVYLSRENVVEHAFSNVKRSVTGVTHIRGANRSNGKVSIPVPLLMDEIRDRLRFKEDELEVLKGLPHLPLVYEENLLDANHHLRTINSIRNYIGLSPVESVTSHYVKISAKSLKDEISNFEEIMTAIEEANLGYLTKQIHGG